MITKINQKNNTKHKIMHCFWDLYIQKGIDKITVSELTSCAKINRSTFYAHFKDIYDVLDQIEEQYLQEGIKFLSHCHDINNKENIYQNFLKLFNENYQKFAFLLSDQGDPNFVVKLKNQARPVFKSHLPNEVMDNKYLDLTIEFVLSSMISVITYWANHTLEITSEELFNHLHNLYMHGIPQSMDLNAEITKD